MNAADLDRLAALAEAATPRVFTPNAADNPFNWTIPYWDFLRECPPETVTALTALIERIRELEGEPIDLGPCSSCNDDANVDCPVACGRA